eukprot:jgi/Chlat1/1603/Chrsp124S01858
MLLRRLLREGTREIHHSCNFFRTTFRLSGYQRAYWATSSISPRASWIWPATETTNRLRLELLGGRELCTGVAHTSGSSHEDDDVVVSTSVSNAAEGANTDTDTDCTKATSLPPTTSTTTSPPTQESTATLPEKKKRGRPRKLPLIPIDSSSTAAATLPPLLPLTDSPVVLKKPVGRPKRLPRWSEGEQASVRAFWEGLGAGLSERQVDTLIRRGETSAFHRDPEKIEARLKELAKAFPMVDIMSYLRKTPETIKINPEKITRNALGLKALLNLNDDEFTKVINRGPNIMGQTPELLARKLLALKALLSLTDDQLRKLIVLSPGVLTRKPVKVRDKLVALTEALHRHRCGDQATALGMVISAPMLLNFSVERLAGTIATLCQRVPPAERDLWGPSIWGHMALVNDRKLARLAYRVEKGVRLAPTTTVDMNIVKWLERHPDYEDWLKGHLLSEENKQALIVSPQT